jgi:hypothetical protein
MKLNIYNNILTKGGKYMGKNNKENISNNA